MKNYLKSAQRNAAACILAAILSAGSALADSVNSVSGPSPIASAARVTVQVNYTATTSRRLEVHLQNPASGWSWHGGANTTVGAGTATASFVFDVYGSPPNGSSYVYQAIIKDTTGNYVASKTQENVTIGSAGPARYEAEAGTLTACSVASSAAGFSGAGYIDGTTFTSSSSKVAVNANADAAGSYTVKIGYRGAYGEKYQNLYVNNNEVGYIQFPASAGWTSISVPNVSLNAGKNVIDLRSSWGWMDIDYLEIAAAGGGGGGNSVYNRVRKVGTNVWFASWNGNNPNNWQSWSGGYVFRADNLNFANETNPWNSAFLDEIKIYQVLRFMDWSGGNGDATDNWVNRPRKSDPYQFGGTMAEDTDRDGYQNDITAVTQPDGRQTRGFALEWCVDLCNRNRSDMWIAVPYRAINPADFPNGTDFNNEYVHKMAILLKTGVDMRGIGLKDRVGGAANLSQLASKTKQDFLNWGGVDTGMKLDGNLKIYLEYSNEVWCCSRPQVKWCEEKSRVIGYTGQWNAYAYFGAYAEVRCFRAFQDVFGSEMASRVIKVSGYQHSYTYNVNEVWDAIVMNTAANRNPWGIKPDAWKWAAYIGGNGSDWYTQVDNYVNGLTQYYAENVKLRDWVRSKGLRYLCYEWAQDLDSGSGNFSRDAASKDKYKYLMNKMASYGYEIGNHYAHFGKWTTDGSGHNSFGAKSYVGQPATESPKYQAIKEWVDGR